MAYSNPLASEKRAFPSNDEPWVFAPLSFLDKGQLTTIWYDFCESIFPEKREGKKP